MSSVPFKEVKVAIVGAGPAGIGAAVGLAKRGVAPVLLVDRCSEGGGLPAKCHASRHGVPTFAVYTRSKVVHGRDFATRLLESLEGTSTQMSLETLVLDVDVAEKTLTLVNPARGKFSVSAEAIIFATGARESTAAERGWIVGARGAEIFNSMQLLELAGRHDALPGKNPAIVGSDLVAYSTAAKLKAAGADDVMMIDTTASPRAGRLVRLFFRRWVRPDWRGPTNLLEIKGHLRVEAISLGNGNKLPCDAVVISGQLQPNSELLVEAGLNVHPRHRTPVVGRGQKISSPGLYVAGNVLGGFHGAQWCYFSGKRAAKHVSTALLSG